MIPVIHMRIRMATSKLATLSLDELYAHPKITPSVEKHIVALEDFSRVSPRYVEKVCKLSGTPFPIFTRPVDILIIQEHPAMPGQYDRFEGQQEQVNQGIINTIAQQAGFGNLTFQVVNLLKCHSPKLKSKTDKKPFSEITLKKFAPYLRYEIEKCNPKAIIATASSVMKALGYAKANINNARGNIFDNKIVLTLHPRVLAMIRQNSSGGFWGQELFNVVKRDFEKAAALARGDLVVPDMNETIKQLLESGRLRFARSIDDVKNLVDTLNSLPESQVVSFDLETTSLDPYQESAKILTIQFGWKDPETNQVVSHLVPLWHRDNDFLNPDEAWDLIAPWLTGNSTKAGHNVKFDIIYIYVTKGIRVKNTVFDTMLCLHALDSGTQGCLSLKRAVWDYLPEKGYAGYEDQLPSLTKKKKVTTDSDEDSAEITEDSKETIED